MLIKRKVTIKVLVTEQFKQQLVAQLRRALGKVEAALQQFDLQGRQYLAEIEQRDPVQGEAYRQKMDQQKRKQEEIRLRLVNELGQAEKLELDSEYIQGSVEGLSEIRVGDNLSERLQEAELLIKDGIVVQISHADE